MIVRIVKMEFEPEKVNAFLELFSATKAKIAGFDGCTGLKLLNDKQSANVFFTYSTWKSVEHLEKYRNSELFRQTWANTKIMFRHKAEAWSVTEVNIE